MPDLTVAAAQSISVAGDVKANVARHLRLMQVAAGLGVRFMVFPELSLTGYEIGRGRELAMRVDDDRLLALREQAKRSGMTAVAGAPVCAADGGKVFIGAIVLGSAGGIAVYTKQHLHPGEDTVFSAGDGGEPVTVGGTGIALAVCADFSQPGHAARAAQSGAGIYAAGVLIGEKGYAADSQLLGGHARRHGMAVLMANHGGETGGWASAGRSAFWAADGRLVVAAPGVGDSLVIAARKSGHWSGKVVAVQI
ncbi:carbon-nitrogen hydrolase family protein [Cupriavidus sp. 30B13]|uniref:carbon-nitrogen hydrolase family protein n=1 Tax=Cupriavidus sp. 30B13 TaxID=3384241 RepID=UPI003B91F9F3